MTQRGGILCGDNQEYRVYFTGNKCGYLIKIAKSGVVDRSGAVHMCVKRIRPGEPSGHVAKTSEQCYHRSTHDLENILSQRGIMSMSSIMTKGKISAAKSLSFLQRRAKSRL
jgi:hypothetical protein